MDKQLAPTYEYLFGDYWVLWFGQSNCYNVIDLVFKTTLDTYLNANSLEDFSHSIDRKIKSDTRKIANALHSYLTDCNIKTTPENFEGIDRIEGKRHLKTNYQYKNDIFTIYYDSVLVKKVIHPAIAHLEIKSDSPAKTIFEIYLNDDELFLFKNDAILTKVPKQEYHKIQGKFFMHLLCEVHHKSEHDWIGTFHGSTISNGNSSIFFAGVSGKGKSTLCGLLAAKGFELVADDASSLSASNLNIYTNPSAVSIKEGSFDVLRPLINNFDAFETHQLNTSKGLTKFIPFATPQKQYYACHNIILVNYKKDAKTELETISVSQLLEVLVPDTWLSPKPEHAKLFLEWLQQVNIYQLTYSDIEEVTDVVSNLFSE